MTLINHADRIRIACLAQIVNVIAPILTERGGRVIRQTTYYPFKYLSLYSKGTALRPVVRTPKLETRYGDAEAVYTSAVYDEEGGFVTLFCLNIGKEEQLLDLDLNSFGRLKMVERIELSGDDLSAVNTFDQPDAVVPKQLPVDGKTDAKFEAKIPGLSWNVLRFKVQ